LSTKKNEQVKQAEVENESIQTNPFVDTLWDQYEQSLGWARKITEGSEDAYLRSVKEVTNFNHKYRNTLTNLYKESRKTNSEIIKGVSSTLVKKGEDGNEVTEQVREVSNRLEKLALTPIKLTFDLFDRYDKTLEENSENFVHYSRERRHSWQKVTNEYIKAARNNHKKLVGRFEESLKVLVNTK
jgi:hypothetical protein